eukprot:5710987-Karenia_brevis.AAC.1
MKSALILDAMARHCTTMFKLLALSTDSDYLADRGRGKDLHASAHTKVQMKSALRQDAMVRK